MQYSSNYHMNKPELAEQYRLSHWNENTDTIDSNLKRIDDLEGNIQNITDPTFKTALLNFCYPIGSLYWSSKDTDPSELFGGTWIQIKDRFIWAKGDEDTVDDTGGSKTVQLTVENLPAHNHTFSGTTGNVTGTSSTWTHSHGMQCYYGNAYSDASVWSYRFAESSNAEHNYVGVKYVDSVNLQHTHTFNGTTGSIGNGTEFPIMPPYVVKYCWERIL